MSTPLVPKLVLAFTNYIIAAEPADIYYALYSLATREEINEFMKLWVQSAKTDTRILGSRKYEATKERQGLRIGKLIRHGGIILEIYANYYLPPRVKYMMYSLAEYIRARDETFLEKARTCLDKMSSVEIDCLISEWKYYHTKDNSEVACEQLISILARGEINSTL